MITPKNHPLSSMYRSPIQTFHRQQQKTIQQSNHPTNRRWNINHIFDQQGEKLNIDKLITMPITKDVWINGLNNKLGRLSNGFKPNNVKGTNTIKFIHQNTIPSNRKITYSNFVCDYRPLKQEKFRVQMTVGGDKLDYPHDTASPTAALIDTKLIINSTISDYKKFG